ncbi:MAG: MFS transporter [Caldilineaceae bacterium]|nr:MFS transporter [Caldilineaceae bacterium]
MSQPPLTGARSVETLSATLPQPVGIPEKLNHILLGLMIPSAIMVLNMSMFSVALPTMRDEFRVEPDQAAWLVAAYTLPFVIFTPLYGRLGDSLGKRRMLLFGIIIYALGAFLSLFAVDQQLIVIGRIAQGIGTAGINPLSIALIAERFPPEQRGRALGSWSSTGPGIATLAPFAAGFLVDHFGWRANFILLLVAALVAFLLMLQFLPASSQPFERRFVRHFDWIGFLLLALACLCFVFYLSSRPITGVEPLQDWRLLLLALLIFASFYAWERYFPAPLIDFSLFARQNFGRASLCALIRMILMNSNDFLIPLYFTDIHNLRPSTLGILLAAYSGALLTTTRLAGQLSDRGFGRWLIVGGLSLQGSMLIVLARLPATTPMLLAVGVVFMLGMGAGLSLAVLSAVAMRDVPAAQAGAAAGLFSMIRFSGSIVGTTLAGVLLRQSLGYSGIPITAYQMVFGAVAAVAIIGALLAVQLKVARTR